MLCGSALVWPDTVPAHPLPQVAQSDVIISTQLLEHAEAVRAPASLTVAICRLEMLSLCPGSQQPRSCQTLESRPSRGAEQALMWCQYRGSHG